MSSCEQAQSALLEQFGAETVPQEVVEHLAVCPECQALVEVLTVLAEQSRAAGQVTMSDAERRDIYDQVMARLTAPVVTPAFGFSWSRLGLSAAALLLATVIGLTGYWLGNRNTTQTMPAVSSEFATITEDQDLEQYQPDPSTVSLLLDDLTTGSLSTALDSLTAGFTDEEFEYLQSSLKESDFL